MHPATDRTGRWSRRDTGTPWRVMHITRWWRSGDAQLAHDTANGRFWHRSSLDGYGEQADGTRWEPVDPGTRETIGRGWLLLTGERGEYEFALGGDAAASTQERLDTMARAADDRSFLMAEHVWDDQPPSAEGAEFVPGEPTSSATPLSWTHGGFIRLAHAVDAGRPVDTPASSPATSGRRSARADRQPVPRARTGRP